MKRYECYRLEEVLNGGWVRFEDAAAEIRHQCILAASRAAEIDKLRNDLTAVTLECDALERRNARLMQVEQAALTLDNVVAEFGANSAYIAEAFQVFSDKIHADVIFPSLSLIQTRETGENDT